MKLDIVIASEGGITLDYLDKLPIPKILIMADELEKILDSANREIKRGMKK